MRSILTAISLIVLSMGIQQAHAQKLVEKHFDFSGKEKVMLNLQIADSINVHTWTKDEVYVKLSIDVNNNKDNDRYKVTFGDTEGTVEAVGKMDDDFRRQRWDDSCCCNRVRVYSEVWLPERAILSVESINANITVDGKTGALRAKSISGFIDVAVSSDRKADVKMNTLTGTVYSNVSLEGLDAKTGLKKHGIGAKMMNTLNGGGDPISLETISGNIYLRKM